MSRTLQSIAFAALAFAAFASPAAAETGRSHEGVQVFYGDLDTTSQAGAKALLTRIRTAARQVCGWDRQARGLELQQQRACLDGAVSRAVARVNVPTVTEMLASKADGRMIFASR